MIKARRGGTRRVYIERLFRSAQKGLCRQTEELTFQTLELPALMSVEPDLEYPGGGGGGIDRGGGSGYGSWGRSELGGVDIENGLKTDENHTLDAPINHAIELHHCSRNEHIQS